MKATKIFSMAWESMTQRKLRASLTTLGVVIGITAIVGLASLGEGFRFEIRQRMQEGFELDVLIIIPGSFTAGLSEPFKPEEVEKVRNVSGVELVAPLVTMPQAKLYANETQINAVTVAGANFSEITNMFPERLTPLYGEIPSEEYNDTIVLGYKTAFMNQSTPLVEIGENITIQITVTGYPIPITKSLKVAAILSKSGTSGLTNFDYWAFIPAKTIFQLVGKETYNIILAKVSNPEQSEQIADNIEKVFDNPYSISILVPIAFMNQVDRILTIVQIFLLAVASISLLVAGIGIMNIMTVSVMERTREIGILKAIGARSRTVLAMFLAEALLIGIVGGLIGVFTGYGLSFGFAYMLSNLIQPQNPDTSSQAFNPQRLEVRPIFSLEWTIIAIVFAVIVCIIFGLYPARKASKLNPVEALRYE